MSQEDTLRLAAEIVDKFSGPLRQMTKSVHQFDDILKGHQARSNVATKEQFQRQKDLNDQFTNTGKLVLGTINPAFAAMGLSVGAVAASTGLLIGQLRAAGDGFLKVQGAMRRTGMSNDGLEVWVRTFGKLGIDAEQAREQLAGLGDVAARLHRNFSPQIQALESQFTNLSGLITNMSKASGAEASEMFWKYYLSHPAPPDQQRKLLAAVGLSPEIANATSDQIKEMIAKAQASVAAHPPIALETMNKIHEAFEEFDDMVKGLNLDLMNAFGGSGANAVKGFGEILHNEAEDIRYIITKAMEFNGWLDKIGGHGDIIGKIVTDMLTAVHIFPVSVVVTVAAAAAGVVDRRFGAHQAATVITLLVTWKAVVHPVPKTCYRAASRAACWRRFVNGLRRHNPSVVAAAAADLQMHRTRRLAARWTIRRLAKRFAPRVMPLAASHGRVVSIVMMARHLAPLAKWALVVSIVTNGLGSWKLTRV